MPSLSLLVLSVMHSVRPRRPTLLRVRDLHHRVRPIVLRNRLQVSPLLSVSATQRTRQCDCSRPPQGAQSEGPVAAKSCQYWVEFKEKQSCGRHSELQQQLFTAKSKYSIYDVVEMLSFMTLAIIVCENEAATR